MSKQKIWIRINGERTSFTLNDPVSLVRAFCVYDRSFIDFDRKATKAREDDDWLNKCIELANKLNARMSEKDKTKIKSLKRKIENRMEKYSLADTCLVRASNPQVEGLVEIIGLGIGESGIGSAKITKVLHAKLPKLVPIVDSEIGELYKGKKFNAKNPEHSRNVIKLIKSDLREKENMEAIRQVQSELSHEIELTEVRIWDIIVWTKARDKGLNILFTKC